MISIGNNNLLSLKEITASFNISEDTVVSVLSENNIKYVNLGNEGYVLESEFINLFKNNSINYSKETGQVGNRRYPITEREILVEAIKILRDKKSISIKELREYLRGNMNLSDDDLIINKNRNDTKFDQKVRNLISHRSGNGFMEICDYKDGYLFLKEE
ncbi:hypothetical protein LGL55_13265 [Clostridium tagluense]|uniref:hypothetical protein n=1 Tax=Clostridium tagluense TaxID=360422 RepID=UPI001CF4D5B2|nr:hypothetical protein [Clostridium tagluense]MCB2312327.1 hypothetical protein [Clostridium tagluense]MCB2316935.1 hypothetical protein [Clostridium tagluense]MCB2321866.1 hypothetical protein [Clostridium tagluense]MCB2326714.1 hypothetical protein [Clostridium tagluense]MCB2331527.1 hypothetical protein [Clostridium tagluense]